jgi:hypothetical protein
MKIQRKSDARVFEFNFNRIGYAKWVVELVAVDDDDRRLHSYGDPISSEREARLYAKNTVENWAYDNRFGWCQVPGNNT